MDAFWREGVAAGYRDDGAPGTRTVYSPDYYGGFLLDPDGHNVELVNHNSSAALGLVPAAGPAAPVDDEQHDADSEDRDAGADRDPASKIDR